MQETLIKLLNMALKNKIKQLKAQAAIANPSQVLVSYEKVLSILELVDTILDPLREQIKVLARIPFLSRLEFVKTAIRVLDSVEEVLDKLPGTAD